MVRRRTFFVSCRLTPFAASRPTPAARLVVVVCALVQFNPELFPLEPPKAQCSKVITMFSGKASLT